ncbi:unnamed protein product [Mytilus edulis]|uniref:C-type lectin domain-containing protein n=1 Tax=Mytilus edulis TaxID=6550 RepID=A0A8S3TX86_MYTED|nr:unnamed protein product [Mytilus edulis]
MKQNFDKISIDFEYLSDCQDFEEFGISDSENIKYDCLNKSSFLNENNMSISKQVDTRSPIGMLKKAFNHWTKSGANDQTFCNSIGGYLAIIETSDEDELLKSYVAIIVPSKDYWIGGSDLATEGVFIWENTSATVNLPTSTLFQGWAQGQPGIDNQHCMMLAHQFDFKWNDAKCDYPRDYV